MFDYLFSSFKVLLQICLVFFSQLHHLKQAVHIIACGLAKTDRLSAASTWATSIAMGQASNVRQQGVTKTAISLRALLIGT